MKVMTSASTLPHRAPVRPKAHVVGTPTSSESDVAIAKAENTEYGDSIARKAIAGPHEPAAKIEPIATIGSRWATSP